MPAITFTTVTQAPDKRLDLEEGHQLIPVGLNNGIGYAELPSGYVGNAVLNLLGEVGQNATLTITQRVDDADVVLALHDQIQITDPSGRSITFAPFIVQ